MYFLEKRRRSEKEERKKSREETEEASDKPKYFDEIEKDEELKTDVSLKDIEKMAKKYDRKKVIVDKTGKDGVSFGEVPDSYAECYPSMQYEVLINIV